MTDQDEREMTAAISRWRQEQPKGQIRRQEREIVQNVSLIVSVSVAVVCALARGANIEARINSSGNRQKRFIGVLLVCGESGFARYGWGRWLSGERNRC